MSVVDLASVIFRLLPEPHAGLLSGILFGTRATISPDLLKALQATGTVHIIALSGMNISIVSGLITLTLCSFFSRRVASLLAIICIGWFVLFVGPSPSVIRAALMGSIGLIAVIFGRRNWAILSWVLTILIMLVFRLTTIDDLSFQLSAMATLGIILFYQEPEASQREETIASFIWERVSDDLRLTLSAQLFTVPLIFMTFGRLSFISPFANLLIGFMVPMITIIGLVGVLLGYVFLPLGQLVIWLVWGMLEYMLWIVTTLSYIPYASIGW